MHEKGLVSFATDPGGILKYGGHCTFFHDGFQKQILAGQNSARVPIIYHFHPEKPRV